MSDALGAILATALVGGVLGAALWGAIYLIASGVNDRLGR